MQKKVKYKKWEQGSLECSLKLLEKKLHLGWQIQASVHNKIDTQHKGSDS